MNIGLLGQYVINGMMLGMMYALVAVGFSLFFGVLDVIQFSHGDVVTGGAFAGLAVYLGLRGVLHSSSLLLVLVLMGAVVAMALLGIAIARGLVLPLRSAPALNTLLLTLMAGTVLRESIRLFFPNGSQPQRFPPLLSERAIALGSLTLRVDNLLLLAAGATLIGGMHLFITRTRLGLAIGSVLAAFAGVMNGLYYNEINFGMGLLLGVIGFSAAVLGGLGNIYGGILGGFLFAGLQTIGAVALPLASAYKDVFAFGVVILLMAWRPTGLIGERTSERV